MMTEQLNYKMEQLFKESNDTIYFYCPLCDSHHPQSSYLAEIFSGDEKARWIANMVTHYRHSHITSWNKCWGRYSGSYRDGWFTDYDAEKHKVNERAKRQIIRKAKEFLRNHDFTVEIFKKLSGTSDETIMLAEKHLGYE